MSVERERVWTTNSFLERIFLATDGSEDAALAGRVAVDLIRRSGAQLHIVHAWQADEKLARLRRANAELAMEIRREPTNEETARRLGWSAREVRFILESGQNSISLNRPAASEEVNSELGDFVEDEEASERLGDLAERMDARRLRDALVQLPERERWVLVRRYVLDGREIATLRELAEELDLSDQAASADGGVDAQDQDATPRGGEPAGGMRG
jgi:DNA-directed RNA polymerase sigma subunit (sigma70/sigma32)